MFCFQVGGLSMLTQIRADAADSELPTPGIPNITASQSVELTKHLHFCCFGIQLMKAAAEIDFLELGDKSKRRNGSHS